MRRYFTLFMRLLSECGDETDDGDVISDDATTRVHVTSLCKNVVVAMSNLLSANIEYGFVHAMGESALSSCGLLVQWGVNLFC